MARRKLWSFDDHPEARDLLRPWADKWIANALSTEPADRPVMIEAMAGLYRAADLTPPERSGAEKGGARTSRPEEDVCPICKGRGFLVLDVPYGHPDFGKLIACRCTEARIALNRSRELHGLSNLGGLERMTFDTFLPDGVSLPESVRTALHRAFDISLDYARDLAKMRSVMAEKGMVWRQVLAGDAWNSPIVKRLGINGIPAPFLVDGAPGWRVASPASLTFND